LNTKQALKKEVIKYIKKGEKQLPKCHPCMHPSKCSSVRHRLVLDLTVFIKLNMCTQQQKLPNNGYINKMYSDTRELFVMIQVNTVDLRKKSTWATQNTSEGHGLRIPELDDMLWIKLPKY
jgi:hypothetical protein